MIKHIVMFKLKDFPAAMERKMKLETIKAELEDLANKIPEIISFEVGINIAVSPVAYDIVLVSEFKNIKDLMIYKEHPEHKRVVEIIAQAKESSVVTDYVIS